MQRNFVNLSPQSLSVWEPELRTKADMLTVAIVAERIIDYREHNNFLTSPCWMDEWAYGFICGQRDMGFLKPWQAQLLFNIFNTEVVFSDRW